MTMRWATSLVIYSRWPSFQRLTVTYSVVANSENCQVAKTSITHHIGISDIYSHMNCIINKHSLNKKTNFEVVYSKGYPFPRL